jgi:hypothetical protein
MATKTDYAFKLLQVVSWIIFIGLCIEAGGFVFNAFITLFVTPEGASKFWVQVDLWALLQHNQSHFVQIAVLMIIVSILKAIMFYIILDILGNKKLDLSSPFDKVVGPPVFSIAYLALGIGLFSYWGMKLTHWLASQGVQMPDIQHLKFGGSDVWLFMGVTLLVFAKIFRKGIELQSDNELTV